ncbi:hypothetical protein AVEN_72157-1 [Araneus ventricosus]|uniref:Uncharacterized protein n=1 Tax=Araneus ventricosus TaxID=182803 RepID=A0A4Y2JAA7_ARAVE|nr:hypothetical protein AVEN_72157-1 [Araneus ventricosus]
MHGGRLRMSLTIPQLLPTPTCQFELSCRRVSKADRIDTPAMYELHGVIRFLQAEDCAVTLFEERKGKLVFRYEKCLNLHSDYVED